MVDFVGGPDDDTFVGAASDDTAAGNGGNDTLAGAAGADELDGGDGDDILFAGLPASVSSVFVPPTLDRATDFDTLLGGAGSDILFGGYGDVIDGGNGEFDTDVLYISFVGAPSGVVIDFNAPVIANGAGSITGIERVAWVEGSAFNDDIAIGDGGSQFEPGVVYGLGGNDHLIAGAFTGWLFGGDGDDVLDGRASSVLEFVDGGDGDDTIDTGNVGAITIFGGEGHDLIRAQGNVDGGAGNDTIHVLASTNVGFYLGGTGNDTIYAADEGTANILGEAGDDTLVGSLGDDILHGGDGDDILLGGGGANILIGGAGADRFEVSALDSGTILDGGTEVDTLAVTGAFVTGEDFLGIDAVELFNGNLTLSGSQFNTGLASDAQISGTGSIIVNLDPGFNFNASGLTLQVGSIVSFAVNGSGVNDSIKSNLHTVNTVNAGGGNDQVRGGLQADTIIGGDGNDKLVGYGGADVLTGGAGADQFRYLFASDSGTGANADFITDFLAGTDKLNFALLDADPVAAGRQALSFIDTAAFSASGAAQVRYGEAGADLLVQVDLDGDGNADMEMVLQGAGGQTLTGVDFLL
jgi:Ca2+-binding RTX toxin-like protein